MKGRSHRLQSHDAAAHEDWIDGSWTVDCVCGVNFDDGEEMVNCDECGVWVHTRCSRYVKGDELFTCHKCKSKNNNRNDNEETEVAQLLVELPTTTIRLETRNATNGPSRRPFRLWTDIPMEKRVHVQGIPGGDPSLFTGLSSVFTPQLWKCTGYVPKKFNFQYREFPCWDEKEEGDAVVNEVENQNTVDKGAGILFSLSKENVLATSAAALIHMRGTDEQAGCDEKVHSKQMKWENEIAEVRHLQIGVKKDKSLLQPIVIQSGKRKSKEVGMPKDCNRKKKSRAAEKDVELNKNSLHDTKSVFTSTSDGKPLEYYEDRGSKSFRTDSQSPKNKNVMETISQGCESDSCTAPGNKAEKPRDNLALVEYSSETLSVEMPRNIFPAGTRPSEGKGRCEVLMGFDNTPKVNLVTLSDLENVDVGRMPVKQEGDGMLHANPDGIAEGSAGSDVKPDEPATVTLEVEDSWINGDCGMFPTLQPNVKVEVADLETRDVLNCPSFTNAKDAETSNSIPENSKQDDATFSGSPLTDYKSQETVEAISESHAEKVQELSGETCLLKQDLDSSENAIPMLQCPVEPKQGSGFTEEPSKSGGANLNSQALPNTVTSNPDTKQQVTRDTNSNIKKDRASSSVARDDDNTSIKITKERSKSSINTMSKVPNSSKTAPTYLPEKILPDSKDSLIYSSSKASLAQNSSETAGLLRNDGASYAQHKPSTSGLPLTSEKVVQSNSQASSKANHTLSMNPSAPANSPAALSDEELALLLHQELNSSPRVPRVPRIRHASSLHQLASPMATSMLMKRTYSAGTKDSISRSKSRDASKDGFHQSHEPDDEDRRINRMPSSPNQRRQNKGYTTETSSKRGDSGSPTLIHSVKKNVPTISTSTANSGPSSSTEVNDNRLSSMRGSPMSISDEETGTILGPVPRTLPGLIDEIMSKGKRMTYEELCNAVLPHWHNLRKHNGDRYAYSSHSQAVLDCLRNRHKWARLVDRGPKANSSRKRRKQDAEDSEDNDYGEGRAQKKGGTKGLESQQEDFPKGKRKARKRRRLALQGRGIKGVGKKHKSNSHTDEDTGSFSNSSEESLFSEDGTQGSGGGTVRVEASATSDEEGTR